MDGEVPILVCGLGRSGLAAARLLRTEGRPVVGLDEGRSPELQRNAEALESLGCAVHLGVETPPDGVFAGAVISPGLPLEGGMLSALRGRGIPLQSELELGWSRFRGRTVAVTGSNGKSSVVKALSSVLSTEDAPSTACGNYGLPVCEALMANPLAKWLVMEVSSFQLETCSVLRPTIALLLNVQPNHLDRHGSMSVYAQLKSRLFAHQGTGNTALTPPDWQESMQSLSGGQGRWITFGCGQGKADFRYSDGVLTGGGVEIGISGSYFDNEVLGPNAAGLLGAALAAGAVPERIAEELCGFEPLPHRARPVAERDGVLYVDDSKATNLSAMMASIRMQRRPVYLIAGGRPKESDFSAAVPLLRERVRGVFLIGEAAGAMEAAWSGAVPCRRAGTLDRAVEAARQAAVSGSVVLLAPACTSYDQFRAYGERGDLFQEIVSKKS